MTEIDKEAQVMNLSARISVLIEILYGLAVGSGFSDALGSFLVSPTVQLSAHGVMGVVFFLMTVLLGVGDWFAYQFFVAPMPYTGIPRILLDIAGPIIIYALFEARSHARIETALVVSYFAMSTWYTYILASELDTSEPRLPRWVCRVNWICLAVSAAACGLAMLANQYLQIVASLACLGCALAWSIPNLWQAHLHLRNNAIARRSRCPGDASDLS